MDTLLPTSHFKESVLFFYSDPTQPEKEKGTRGRNLRKTMEMQLLKGDQGTLKEHEEQG